MNDIQKQFLILITMMILSLWKIADLVILAFAKLEHLPAICGFITIFIVFFIIRYNAYKSKGGQ